MAEMLFREMVAGRDDFVVGSAGVGAMNGQAASKHTAELLKEEGIDPAVFCSRAMTEELMQTATHVFAMSKQHLAVLDYDFPDLMDKAYLVTEFVADDALRGRDVVDPFGMGRAAYEQTLSMLKASLPSVLAFIDQTAKGK
jgi:glycine hydroxymethyltransferase